MDFSQSFRFSKEFAKIKTNGIKHQALYNVLHKCVALLTIIAMVWMVYSFMMFEQKENTRKIKTYEQPQIYRKNLTARVQLQEPKNYQQKIVVLRIQQKSQIRQSNHQYCLFVNSLNIATHNSLENVKTILSQEKFKTCYLIITQTDYKIISQNKTGLKNFYLQKIAEAANLRQDIIDQIRNQCMLKVLYIFGNFKITKQMFQNIAYQASTTPPDTLFFTSSAMRRNQLVKLPNLATTDLQQIQPTLLYSYLYIFDTRFLSIMAPTNFAYYAKYTIEQIFLLPTLALYQSAGKLITNDKVMHSFPQTFIHSKQFPVWPAQPSDNSVCFVSYPSELYTTSTHSALTYIKSVEDLDNSDAQITVVVYLPYNFGQSQEIFKVASYLAGSSAFDRVRLSIVANKTAPSHVVYDAVHSHCPSKSMIVSSRHNVQFHKDLVTTIIKEKSARYHYYDIGVDSSFAIEVQPGRQYGDDQLESKLHVQVFKSDLFKMIPFWTLKSAEIDFYETEVPFVRHMMQINNYSYASIPKTLATVYSRTISLTQWSQIRNVKQYAAYFPITDNVLTPYKYNSLLNPVHRKNAPQKISRIIHQTWIGKGQIAQIRNILRESIIKANPNFQVKLWKAENITKTNFPITYDLINMVLQKHKSWYRSLYAMVSAIMRYELIVQFGGIYLDFKFEGRKPLDNFLKYQLFFIDTEISTWRLGSPKTLGNGAMGGTQNNYHLRLVLTEILNQHSFTFYALDLPWVTGSFMLRKSVTDSELFTHLGFGYHFFFARPYEKIKDFCGGVNRKFDDDQRVFQVKYSREKQKMAIGYPCKLYPEAYIVLYTPLSQTWIGSKAEAD